MEGIILPTTRHALVHLSGWSFHCVPCIHLCFFSQLIRGGLGFEPRESRSGAYTLKSDSSTRSFLLIYFEDFPMTLTIFLNLTKT